MAITSARRASVLPDMPTVTEAGLRDCDVSAWSGLIAPALVDDAIVGKIHNDVARIAQEKNFIDLLPPQTLEVALMQPQGFRAFLPAEVAK